MSDPNAAAISAQDDKQPLSAEQRIALLEEKLAKVTRYAVRLGRTQTEFQEDLDDLRRHCFEGGLGED